MNTFTMERNNYRRKLITLVKHHTILWNKKTHRINKKLPQKLKEWQEISDELNISAERNKYRRKLIMVVKQYSILWNKTQENYNRNRKQKIQAWHEISEQLGIDVDKLRRTWENLRDQYRRDLKREMKYGFKSKWRFFNDMDFIRGMVQCKESQNEYTDSDSELEITDQTQQLNQTQCSVITTNMTTTTTPTVTIQANLINLQPPNFPIPFQPILLTKQWQEEPNVEIPKPQDQLGALVFNPNLTANYLTAEETCAPSQTFQLMEYPSSCDSSKDFNLQQVSEPPPYEIVAKQEPDLELENESPPPPPVVIEKQFTTSNASHDAREFQEPSVSTSCQKRTRVANEDAADTSSYTVAKLCRNSDSDFDVKDDDYYFVMSLLPSLRQIPRHRKFPLRLGIMNLIAKDLEEVVKEF